MASAVDACVMLLYNIGIQVTYQGMINTDVGDIIYEKTGVLLVAMDQYNIKNYSEIKDSYP